MAAFESRLFATFNIQLQNKKVPQGDTSHNVSGRRSFRKNRCIMRRGEQGQKLNQTGLEEVNFQFDFNGLNFKKQHVASGSCIEGIQTLQNSMMGPQTTVGRSDTRVWLSFPEALVSSLNALLSHRSAKSPLQTQTGSRHARLNQSLVFLDLQSQCHTKELTLFSYSLTKAASWRKRQ